MKYTDREQHLRATLAAADAMGDAVILSLARDSEPARAMAEAIFREPACPPEIETGETLGFLPVAVPAVQARDLLTRYAGGAGAAIADTLTSDSCDRRCVYVGAEDITLDAYVKGFRLYTQRVALGLAAGPHAGSVIEYNYPLSDKSIVSVVVPTVDDGVEVGVLVHMSDTRTVVGPIGSGQTRKLDAHALSHILRKGFADKAPNIARAIRALRGHHRRKEAWLARVLKERPELGWLARKVWRELEAL